MSNQNRNRSSEMTELDGIELEATAGGSCSAGSYDGPQADAAGYTADGMYDLGGGTWGANDGSNSTSYWYCN